MEKQKIDNYYSKEQELKLEILDLANQLIEKNEIIATLTKQINDFKAKEQSISAAIIAAAEKAKQMEEASRKLFQIEIQRNRLLYMRMEQVLNELHSKYPDLKTDTQIEDLSQRFKNLVSTNYDNIPTKNFMGDLDIVEPEDPIKKMLNKITNYCDVKEQPVKKAIGDTENNVFKSNSGFDMREALNPTQELNDILKAFDLGDKKNK